jgi:hypothetical protein
VFTLLSPQFLPTLQLTACACMFLTALHCIVHCSLADVAGRMIENKALSGHSVARPLSTLAGVTDHLAENEAHALSIARDILGNLGSAAGQAAADGQISARQVDLPSEWEEPVFTAEELRGEWCNECSDLVLCLFFYSKPGISFRMDIG